MISIKLLRQINKVTGLLESEAEFRDVVYSLSDIHSNIETFLKNIVIQSDAQKIIHNKETARSGLISETQVAVRKARFSTIASAAQKLRESLLASDTPALTSALSTTDNFIEALDENLHSHNLETSIELVKSAHLLTRSFDKIATTKEAILSIYTPNESDLPSLSIYIPDNINLSSFSQKIEAISEILDICCKLLDMSTSEGNVSIEKIESGSFFAKISANPLVIALASIIVTNGSQYIYNEIDSSRDLTNLKEASEVLERTLKIRSFLEENEIDTKEIDEEIKISSVLLAKNLGLLIKDSSEIEINDNKITTPNGHNLIGKAKPALENK